MSRKYQPTGHHKPGPKPGSKHKKNPLEPERCGCGKDAIHMGGDECAKCGKRLPDH